MHRLIPIFILSTMLLSSGCAQKKDNIVTIKTAYGDMVAILYDETPKHKANFIKLANEKFYDSLLFHRIIPKFMIQGGDPNSKGASKSDRLGNGGPGYTVDAEINPKFFHMKGALSAARLGDAQNPTKASSGSQFYIVQGDVISEERKADLQIDAMKLNHAMRAFVAIPESKPLLDSLNEVYKEDPSAYQGALYAVIPRIEQATNIKIRRDISEEMLNAYTTIGGAPHLDGNYTVFGKVISGLDVIDKIAAVERDAADRPLEDIIMSIEVKELKRKKITKLYGYSYE